MEKLARYPEAMSHYEAAVRLRPGDLQAVNDLAWLLATCSLDEVRDGRRALQLASRLADLQGPSRFAVLDTLAAAHAEQGQFAQAVKWQTKAVELSPAASKDELQARLELYRAEKPYRDKPSGS